MTRKFEIDLWSRNYISSKSSAAWACGKCFNGALQITNQHVTSDRENGMAIFRCTNSHCRNEYSSCGKIVFWSPETNWEVSKEYQGKTIVQYHPIFFFPEIQLFKVPEQCSEEVKREINYAFKHFWSDYYATLNALRRSLEYLMDQLNIPEREVLHQRIELFAKEYPKLKETILAVKVMGNEGSHKSIVQKNELLNALEIYHYTLHQIFPDNHESEILAKARKINEEKSRKK